MSPPLLDPVLPSISQVVRHTLQHLLTMLSEADNTPPTLDTHNTVNIVTNDPRTACTLPVHKTRVMQLRWEPADPVLHRFDAVEARIAAFALGIAGAGSLSCSWGAVHGSIIVRPVSGVRGTAGARTTAKHITLQQSSKAHMVFRSGAKPSGHAQHGQTTTRQGGDLYIRHLGGCSCFQAVLGTHGEVQAYVIAVCCVRCAAQIHQASTGRRYKLTYQLAAGWQAYYDLEMTQSTT